MKKTLLIGFFLCSIGFTLFCTDDRAAAPKQFLNQVSQTIKSSHNRLTKMHSSGLNGMGREEKQGGVSGSVTYWARKTKGILIPTEVTVDFIYTNYCDSDLVLNGTLTSTITDVMDRSGSMTGTVWADGIIAGREHSGSVRYNLKIVAGDAAAGFYYVIQNGGSEIRLSWTSLD